MPLSAASWKLTPLISRTMLGAWRTVWPWRTIVSAVLPRAARLRPGLSSQTPSGLPVLAATRRNPTAQGAALGNQCEAPGKGPTGRDRPFWTAATGTSPRGRSMLGRATSRVSTSGAPSAASAAGRSCGRRTTSATFVPGWSSGPTPRTCSSPVTRRPLGRTTCRYWSVVTWTAPGSISGAVATATVYAHGRGLAHCSPS